MTACTTAQTSKSPNYTIPPQLPQSPQRPSRLRELGDIRERITGCPDRPPSSRGKRSKRPSSPVPGELTDQNLPWKLKNIPQPPSPRHEQAVIVNGNGTEAAEVPTRPKTARGGLQIW
eukprot:sb/3476451/